MELWITPLAGAAIGYFTNWLAVKMLFRPYREKHFLGKALPFTPGLIPKERDKIARKIGKTVSGHLLTEKMLTDKLLSANMVEQLDQKLTEKWLALKTKEQTVQELLNGVFRQEEEKLFPAIASYLLKQGDFFFLQEKGKRRIFSFVDAAFDKLLEKKVSELPLEKWIDHWQEILLAKGQEWKEEGILAELIEKGIWQAVLEAASREEKIEDYLTLEEIRGIKDYLSLKAPKAALAILSFCEDPEIEKKLRAKLRRAIRGATGTLVGFFVDTDSIYDKAKEQITAYFQNPENGPEIDAVVERIVERGLEYPIGALASAIKSEARETGIGHFARKAADILLQEKTLLALMARIEKAAMEQKEKTIGQALEEIAPGMIAAGKEKVWELVEQGMKTYGKPIFTSILNQCIERIENYPIPLLMEQVSLALFARGKEVILEQVQNIVKECTPQIVASLNIAELIETQVQSFDMQMTEKLVLSVADKELRAITWIGGVLGFVIGCIPLFLP